MKNCSKCFKKADFPKALTSKLKWLDHFQKLLQFAFPRIWREQNNLGRAMGNLDLVGWTNQRTWWSFCNFSFLNSNKTSVCEISSGLTVKECNHCIIVNAKRAHTSKAFDWLSSADFYVDLISATCSITRAQQHTELISANQSINVYYSSNNPSNFPSE